MTETTGLSVAVGIERLEREQYEANRKKYMSAVAKHSGHFEEKFGAALTREMLSDLAPLMRRNNDDDKAARIMKRYPELTSLGATKINELAEEVEDLLGQAQRDYFQARNRMTFATTVLRPLENKWLERWRLERQDFDYEIAGRKADALLETKISNEGDLWLWSRDVLEFFKEVGVYHGSGPSFEIKDGKRISSGPSKPMGTVGHMSSRIYLAAWNALFEEDKGAQVLAYAKQAAESLRSRDIAMYGTREAPSIQFISAMSLPDAPTSALSVPEDESGVQLSLVSSEDNQIRASKNWPRREIALLEAENWLRALAVLWGQSGKLVQATIENKSNSGKSEITLPAMPLEGLAAIINTALRT